MWAAHIFLIKNHPTFQNMKSLNFFIVLRVIFALPESETLGLETGLGLTTGRKCYTLSCRHKVVFSHQSIFAEVWNLDQNLTKAGC
jgi:hypothetical protein